MSEIASTASGVVTSVVLNWRKPEMTAACVERLLAADYPRHEVVIVDNGSGDGSADDLAERFPSLVVIRSEENLGFSRGCNLGIRHAVERGSEYVALVNNDLMLEPHSVSAAVEALERNPRHGAVTGKIYWTEPGVLWQAGGHIDHRRIMGVPRGFLEKDDGSFEAEIDTGWASGAMSTFRASALHEVGLLPEEYFFGQEEWAVSTALLRRGHTIGYVPTYVGRHSNGGSYVPHPALNSYGSARNRCLYAETYLSRGRYLVWRALMHAHVRFRMRRRLVEAGTHDQPATHVRAMLLGLRRHRRGSPVTLAELTAVARELGVPTSWESKPA